MTTKRPRMGIFLLARQVSSQKMGDMKGAIACSLSWLSLPTRFRQVKSYSLLNLWLSNKVVYIARTREAICDNCDSNPSFLSASSWIKERSGGRLKRNDCGSAMEVKISGTLWKNPSKKLVHRSAHNDNYLIGFSGIIPSTTPPPLPLPHPPSTAVCPKKDSLLDSFCWKVNIVWGESGEVASFTVIVGKVQTLLTSIILVKVLIRFN